MWLEDHDKVEKVYFPGLKSHSDYELAGKQQRGPGAMISFEVKGDGTDARNMGESTSLIKLAESLGGVTSLIEVPALQSHASMTPEARDAAGINDTLVRFSVGLEEVEDLKKDLELGLSKVKVQEPVLVANH